MRMRLLALLLVGVSFCAAAMFQSVPEENATLIQQGNEKYACPNCGMHLVKFYKTSHTHENHQYCSIHCLYEATQGTIPSDAKVVDVTSLKLVEAKSAFYVVGSNVRGTMSKTSSYAFALEKDAQAFMSQNGGRIVSFDEAYAIASEDFPKGSIKPEAVPSSMSNKIFVPKEAKCPVCGMFVAKYAQWAAVIEDGESNLYFDGVKDMMKYIFDKKTAFEKVFVTDYYKLNKIEAKKAFYVMGSNVMGPMGTELIPFSSEKDAYTFSKDHNGKKVVRFEEIDEKLIKSL